MSLTARRYRPDVRDLAVIIVSTDQSRWLRRCLPSVLSRADGVELDLVVVDNGEGRETQELVDRHFSQARLLQCENRGYAHANNLAVATCDSRWVLFLNPDTELLED